jgi:Tfp pilus assembly protein PilX
MSIRPMHHAERGAVLLAGLIMLLLFTLLLSGALTLSNVNLQAVGNAQARTEALAAANSSLELKISQDFTTGSAPSTTNVDINNDGVRDYVASIDKPLCIRATVAQAIDPSSASLAGISSGTWNTVWLLRSQVTDPASGAAVAVRAGVRVLLDDTQYQANCL